MFTSIRHRRVSLILFSAVSRMKKQICRKSGYKLRGFSGVSFFHSSRLIRYTTVCSFPLSVNSAIGVIPFARAVEDDGILDFFHIRIYGTERRVDKTVGESVVGHLSYLRLCFFIASNVLSLISCSILHASAAAVSSSTPMDIRSFVSTV